MNISSSGKTIEFNLKRLNVALLDKSDTNRKFKPNNQKIRLIIKLQNMKTWNIFTL